MKSYLGILAGILLVITGTAFAGDPVRLQPGVARVSLIHGDVTLQRGDSKDWVAATLNTPVVAGDQIATGVRSRAEIQLDYANVVRLGENSTVKIADLTRTRIQVQVGMGLANYSVLRGSEADAEVDTPNIAVHPVRDGRYRIEVNSETETEVIVRDGEAEITTPQGSTRVPSGQMITVQGTTNPQYQTVDAPRKDDFDSWNSDRDHLIARAESWRHTDRYYTGSEDLDVYGHWQSVPDYGSVWIPAQGPDWAPYRDGRWVWEPYYGWTWVSYEPWGWAPYHYGRWFLYSGSWCWWPGPVRLYPAYYPLWAPAYVSFFGFHHGGFGFGFGFGHIGWLPIGPGDGFYPWYGRHVNVVNVTNITNITNITNVRNVNGVQPLFRGARGISNLHTAMNNPRLLRGVSTMPTEHFGRGAVPRGQQGIDSGEFRQGGVLTGRVPIVPTRASLRPVDRNVNPPANAVRGGNQRFFGTRQPTTSSRPFNQQAAQVQKMIAQSPRTQPMPSGRHPNVSAGRSPATDRGSPPEGTRSGGFRPMGPSGSRNGVDKPLGPSSPQRGAPGTMDRSPASRTSQGQGPTQSEARPGWRSFGEGSGGSMDRGAAPQINRPLNNGAVPRGSSNNQPSEASGSRGPAWHSFSRPNGSTAGQSGESAAPSTMRPSGSGAWNRTGDRVESAPAARGIGQTSGGNSNGWHRFTPSSQSASGGESRGAQPQEFGNRGSGSRVAQPPRSAPSEGSGWQRFTPRSESGGSSSPSNNNSWRSPSSNGGGRPPLDLRQPVVTPRSSSGQGDYGRGGYGRGSYSGSSSGGYSRPQGGYSSGGGYQGGGGPSGGHSSGGGGGGGRQSGGGHPSGGGASHSSGNHH